jgi:NDP-sugar pyrophosphorylase family protein
MLMGYMATACSNVLGDGSAYGMRIRYVEEPDPRGTAGALKYAESLLDERFFMLNGDVLTDLDLSRPARPARAHRRPRDARPRPRRRPVAYGLVRTEPDGAVREFVEKPPADQIDTNLISAGAYILERSVLDLIEPDRNVSIEREIWPALVGEGLYAYGHEQAYWMDIGHARALPAGHLRHHRGPRPDRRHRAAGRQLHGRRRRLRDRRAVVPPAVVGRRVRVAGRRAGRLARRPRRRRDRRRGRHHRAFRRHAGHRASAGLRAERAASSRRARASARARRSPTAPSSARA